MCFFFCDLFLLCWKAQPTTLSGLELHIFLVLTIIIITPLVVLSKTNLKMIIMIRKASAHCAYYGSVIKLQKLFYFFWLNHKVTKLLTIFKPIATSHIQIFFPALRSGQVQCFKNWNLHPVAITFHNNTIAKEVGKFLEK